LPSTGGNGTIAIVDAYDCPTIESDFISFSQQFGLPTTNFEKHKMADSIEVVVSWALEIALDVQWAHAIAPDAHILLVEAVNSSWPSLLEAVDYATSRPDVVAVSMSWGDEEFPTQSSYNYHFNNDNGVAFFAASGDESSVIWPASSPNVVAVGGTTLVLDAEGAVIFESAWSKSGGGVSVYEEQPQYQADYNVSGVNGMRSVPDVSYNADPLFGVSVYLSTSYGGQTGWFTLGGTSAGTPQWAAIHSLGLSASHNNLYQDAKNNSTLYFRDITSGSNGRYAAASGYDMVTGLGSPITHNFAELDFGGLNVTVTTDRARYPKWSYVSIGVAVADENNTDLLRGALVTVEVYDTFGRNVWTSSGLTDMQGCIQFVYKLFFTAKMGTYTIATSVSLPGYRTNHVQSSFFSLG
jgi:subtilase family serine protease